MERIDVLTPDMTDCPSFVVDITKDAVNLSVIGTPKKLLGGDGVSGNFPVGESIEILSVGYILPDRFTVYEGNALGSSLTTMSMRLFASATVGGTIPLYQVGVDGYVKIPFNNYEMCLGVFIPDIEGVTPDTHFDLKYEIPNPLKISMVNAPAAIDGDTLHLVPFVKVLHNFALTV